MSPRPRARSLQAVFWWCTACLKFWPRQSRDPCISAHFLKEEQFKYSKLAKNDEFSVCSIRFFVGKWPKTGKNVEYKLKSWHAQPSFVEGTVEILWCSEEWWIFCLFHSEFWFKLAQNKQKMWNYKLNSWRAQPSQWKKGFGYSGAAKSGRFFTPSIWYFGWSSANKAKDIKLKAEFLACTAFFADILPLKWNCC